MAEKRIYPPPKPSTPREAPWREIEQIIDKLGVVVEKLCILISIYTGVPPGEIPGGIPVPNRATFATGQRDVATAGEPEQLDDLPIPDGFKLTVIARTGNGGVIYFGKSKGDCANNKRRFDGLFAGLAHSFGVKNASAVWVDAEVSGEGVSWSVEQDA